MTLKGRKEQERKGATPEGRKEQEGGKEVTDYFRQEGEGRREGGKAQRLCIRIRQSQKEGQGREALQARAPPLKVGNLS